MATIIYSMRYETADMQCVMLYGKTDMLDDMLANITIRINDDGYDGIRIRVASSLPLNVAGRLDVWGTR